MAAYRYHRIRATDVIWMNYYGPTCHVVYREVRFYTGENQTGTEFAMLGTAFATDYVQDHPPSYAIDNNTSTYYLSTLTTSLKTWGIDLGANVSYTLGSFSIISHADQYGSYMPKSFILEGSNNNTDWFLTSTTIYTTVNTNASGTLYNFAVTSPNIGFFSIIPAMTIY